MMYGEFDVAASEREAPLLCSPVTARGRSRDGGSNVRAMWTRSGSPLELPGHGSTIDTSASLAITDHHTHLARQSTVIYWRHLHLIAFVKSVAPFPAQSFLSR